VINPLPRASASEREVIGALSHIWDEESAAIRLLERRALRADQVVAVRIALEETVMIGFERNGGEDQPALKVLVSPVLRPGAAA
jgi:hypothetical protein